MLKISKNNIYLTRGDSAYIPFTLTYANGQKYNFDENDKVRIQVRYKPNNGELAFEGDVYIREDGSIMWHIHPDDTKRLSVDRDYYYDAQIEVSNGDVFTFVKSSLLRLMDEVTYDE